MPGSASRPAREHGVAGDRDGIYVREDPRLELREIRGVDPHLGRLRRSLAIGFGLHARRFTFALGPCVASFACADHRRVAGHVQRPALPPMKLF